MFPQNMAHVVGKNRKELLAMAKGHGDGKKGESSFYQKLFWLKVLVIFSFYVMCSSHLMYVVLNSHFLIVFLYIPIEFNS